MGDVPWLIIQESMLVQLMSWTGSNHIWGMKCHQQLQHHLHLLDVDLLNGPMTSGVMMRTTMLNATGMEVLVVIILELDGIIIVQLVNVLIPMLVLQLVKTNVRRKKSRQIVKKHADTVKQDQCFNLPFARMSI